MLATNSAAGANFAGIPPGFQSIPEFRGCSQNFPEICAEDISYIRRPRKRPGANGEMSTVVGLPAAISEISLPVIAPNVSPI